jgi:uncharacterized protein YqeY
MKNTYIEVAGALAQARKGGDRFGVTVLSTLLGEMQNKIPKDATPDQQHAQATAIVKKFIEGIDETTKVTPDKNKRLLLSTERLILEEFMPAQLTDEELEFAIDKISRRPHVGRHWTSCSYQRIVFVTSHH